MPRSSAYWIDGERRDTFSLPDRGLDYGDGLFETLLLENGEALFPELHWQRLRRGLKVLDFPDCLEQVLSQVQATISELKGEQAWRRAALRVTVTRGAGPRGYAPPEESRPRIVISASALPPSDTLPKPATLIQASIRWGSQPALAGIKHLNRLEQVIAAAEKQRAGADEALMLGQGDQLVSVTSGNLFVVADNEIHTPLLNECGIEGTRRRLVIDNWAPAAGYRVGESRLELDLLESASEVFFSNTLLGLRPVAALNGLRWDDHAVCQALYQQYRKGAA